MRHAAEKDSTASVNYRRGVTSLAILALLRQQDMYGYQMVQEMARQSEGNLTTQEGSLYPVLYKLSDAGYVSERKVQSGKRQVRNYYHLEPSGEKYLERLIRDYTAVTGSVFRIINGDAAADAGSKS